MDTIVGDGCTLWLDGLGPFDWRHCCDAHDLAYSELADKLTADLELMACVTQAGAPAMGLIMFLGVTVFGWLWYKKSRREREI